MLGVFNLAETAVGVQAIRGKSRVAYTSHADRESWLDLFPLFISQLPLCGKPRRHADICLRSVRLRSHSTSTSSCSLPPSCRIASLIYLDQPSLNSLHIQFLPILAFRGCFFYSIPWLLHAQPHIKTSCFMAATLDFLLIKTLYF